ncbi:hypothetical protein P153DRAFT_303597 [Dothidotthia symphoricarpi CBS 119687]|uniref:JmjC domain-containing protein n=1 Tax=Dothidotthia symphoricarpi CBS 119687 TaxID=1392245 RepID=A0A6A5ZX75_9PLEO|nr:uncharacterized protein P153DRAFT_303597 [Dothidotthia symphoricarpi CBS 119687]KAF2123625.1 hypothetical protein P153DRAFT_303597 [Dothidotthia symphoricarpi CBS 119687]
MEEAIHNHNEGYDSCLKAYEEFLRHYKRTDLQGEQRMELPNHHYIPRMATFSPGYIGNGSSTLPRGDFEISEKHHLGGCQILCATIDQLRAAKKGKGIPHAPYVLIPPDNNRPPDTSNLFRELEQSYIIADFLQRLNQPHGTRQLYHDGQPPLNFLNISGSVGTHISRENDVVEELDLTLLHTLTSSLRGKINANIGCGKEAIQTAALNDMKSCMSFHLVGERGTMSAWHQDIVGGTHITPVSGGKLWSIYDGPVNDEVIESFSSTAEHGGVLWKPPAGTVFTIYLAPQWTLVMNGDFTPHMATSIGGPFTHLVGGQVWSSEPEKLEPLLQKQKWLIENVNVASNEPVPRQLPDVLLELELYIIRSISEHNNLTRTYPTSLPRYTETHLQLLRSFISHIKPLLMCNCKRGSCRPPKCPCKFISSEYGDEVGGINTVKHIGGCTAFCHPDYSDPATRACKRTALAKS